ncbi:hypothetical protein ABZS90_19010 [Streptomyces cyaneofuscatus]
MSGSLVTLPDASSTTAVNPPRPAPRAVRSLVNVRGAYTTTVWSPDAVTQALPIHWSASNPGSVRDAVVFPAYPSLSRAVITWNPWASPEVVQATSPDFR